MNTKFKKTVIAYSLAATGLFAFNANAETDWKGESQDAWIDGKLESSYLLNTELNNFKIDTMVESGTVTLAGNVPSEAHRDLAEQIAKNLEGVNGVNNQLSVGDEVVSYSEQDRNFSTYFHDATTTVSLKSKFAVNSELDALDINIDTKNGKVTLEGNVKNDAEKALAEEIAEGHEYVTSVDNRLLVQR